MSTFQKLRKSKLVRFIWMGDRALLTKKQQGRWRSVPQATLFLSLNQIWQFFLAAASGDDLRIWQTSDNDGNTWWHGCDRATGRSTCVATEDEMRAWLDRHYYQ